MSTSNSAAKFAFFYILSLVALAFMAISSGMVIFQIINKSIPDIALDYSSSFSAGALKFAISAIIVSTPIFYLTIRQIYRNLRSGNLKPDSGVRKWLTYLIILIAVLVMLGSLIAVLNSFLSGELTTKFIFKALTTLVISGAIFFFYFHDIRRDSVTGKDQIMTMYTYLSLAAVIAIFIVSLFFVESPVESRNRRIDERTLNNFSQIKSAAEQYYSSKGNLPENLNILAEEYKYVTTDILKNPNTGQAYEYRVVESDKFELCTDFMTSNMDSENQAPYYYRDYYATEWPHESGRDCIEQKVVNYNNPPKPIDTVVPR